MSTVLVTGGTGTIGSAMVRSLMARCDITRVIVLSRNDSRQHQLSCEFANVDCPTLDFILGDIRDPAVVQKAMASTPDVVYHCAAIKHVWAAEVNVVEATEINVKGTQNVLEALAHVSHIGQYSPIFVLLSTDKAAAPTSIMGMTKLMAEAVVRDVMTGTHVRKAIVRFGNVLGSNGSVIPTWGDAITRGDSIKVTNFAVTRYAMTPDEAVAAMLHASIIAGDDAPTFVPRMKSRSLQDIFYEVCENMQVEVKDVKIDTIGMQPGEKKHEACVSAEEATRVNSISVDGLIFGSHVMVPFIDEALLHKNFNEAIRPFLSSEYAQTNVTIA